MGVNHSFQRTAYLLNDASICACVANIVLIITRRRRCCLLKLSYPCSRLKRGDDPFQAIAITDPLPKIKNKQNTFRQKSKPRKSKQKQRCDNWTHKRNLNGQEAANWLIAVDQFAESHQHRHAKKRGDATTGWVIHKSNEMRRFAFVYLLILFVCFTPFLPLKTNLSISVSQVSQLWQHQRSVMLNVLPNASSGSLNFALVRQPTPPSTRTSSSRKLMGIQALIQASVCVAVAIIFGTLR